MLMKTLSVEMVELKRKPNEEKKQEEDMKKKLKEEEEMKTWKRDRKR